MHPNVEVVNRFYSAFARHDAASMAACYHRDVTFHDPVFLTLQGDRARGLWRLLCERAKDMTLQWGDIIATEHAATAHWEAKYRLLVTGRKVHKIAVAQFEFKDGLIWKHTDQFDIRRWTRQALGLAGLLVGHTEKTQSKIRAAVIETLDDYLNNPSTPGPPLV